MALTSPTAIVSVHNELSLYAVCDFVLVMAHGELPEDQCSGKGDHTEPRGRERNPGQDIKTYDTHDVLSTIDCTIQYE